MTDGSASSAAATKARRGGGARLDWIVGGLVVAAFLVGQFLLYPGPHPYDPATYFDLGLRYPDIDANHWSHRIGLVFPARLAIVLLGPTELALYLVPLAAGVLLTVSVYVLVLLLFEDRAVAAAAALLMVLSPTYLLNSPYLLPDTIGTATFTAGFLCLVLGRGENHARAWYPVAAAAGAGFFFGWSYLIREFTPVLFPAVIVAVVLLRYPVRRMAAVAGTAVLIGGLELLYGARRYGDPLARIHEMLEPRFSSYHHRLWAPFREQVTSPADAVLVLPRLLLTWRSGWVAVALLVVFLVALFRFRNRTLWLLAGWFLSYWAMLILFASIRRPSGDSLLNVGNIRYWYPLLPPLVMGGVAGLALLIKGTSATLRRTFVARVVVLSLAAAVVVPGAVAFSTCADLDLWRNEPSQRWEEVRSWLAGPEAAQYDVIWADLPSKRLLTVYSQSRGGVRLWHGDLRTLPKDPPASAQSNGLIVVHGRRTSRKLQAQLQEAWAPVFVTGDGGLAAVAPRTQPTASGAEPWAVRAGIPSQLPGGCGLSPYERGRGLRGGPGDATAHGPVSPPSRDRARLTWSAWP